MALASAAYRAPKNSIRAQGLPPRRHTKVNCIRSNSAESVNEKAQNIHLWVIGTTPVVKLQAMTRSGNC